MNKFRNLSLLLTGFLLTGCLAGTIKLEKSKKLSAQGEQAYKAGRHQQCVDIVNQAIAFTEEGSRVGDVGDRKTAISYMGKNLHRRALCQWELGKKNEAVKDMEEAVQYFNQFCGVVTLNRVRDCDQSADSMEQLAKWKKELGVKEVKP